MNCHHPCDSFGACDNIEFLLLNEYKAAEDPDIPVHFNSTWDGY